MLGWSGGNLAKADQALHRLELLLAVHAMAGGVGQPEGGDGGVAGRLLRLRTPDHRPYPAGFSKEDTGPRGPGTATRLLDLLWRGLGYVRRWLG